MYYIFSSKMLATYIWIYDIMKAEENQAQKSDETKILVNSPREGSTHMQWSEFTHGKKISGGGISMSKDRNLRESPKAGLPVVWYATEWWGATAGGVGKDRSPQNLTCL